MERIRSAQAAAPDAPPPEEVPEVETTWEEAKANLAAAFPQGHLEEHYQLEDGSWVNRDTGEMTPGMVPGN